MCSVGVLAPGQGGGAFSDPIPPFGLVTSTESIHYGRFCAEIGNLRVGICIMLVYMIRFLVEFAKNLHLGRFFLPGEKYWSEMRKNSFSIL